jgi:hypothetical protein
MTQTGEQAAQRPAAPPDPGRQVLHDIDQTLDQRSAPPGTFRARVEDETKRGGAVVWHTFKKRPSIGALVLGGLAIAAADAIGVGEVAVGVAIGYVAWRVLRKGKNAGEAIEGSEQLERG